VEGLTLGDIENIVDDSEQRTGEGRDDHEVLSLLPSELALEGEDGHSCEGEEFKSQQGSKLSQR